MELKEYSKYFGKIPSDLNLDEIKRLITYFSLLSRVENPVASLVIPIYRASDTLLAHIISLSHIKTIIPYEVIFVDNNADDKSMEILRTLGANICKQPIQGITMARQRGLEQAKGQIVCTMDPDSIYDPYYVDKMVLPFFYDEKVVLCYALTKRYKGAFEVDFFLKIRNWLKLSYYHLLMRSRNVQQSRFVRGVAMAVRREVFAPIGYLTDLRVAPGCDDGMVAMHMHNHGKFKFVPISVYTATPPKRAPNQPFPFCNQRFYNSTDLLELSQSSSSKVAEKVTV